jgi:hypothetical protein
MKNCQADAAQVTCDILHKVYNTLKAKAVRGVALGIGGMAGAGVARAAFIGDRDAVAAKKAGDVASIMVRKIFKIHMLKLDNFNANENTDNSVIDIADDLASETFDSSPDCENASDTANDSAGELEGDTSDDLADDDDLVDNNIENANAGVVTGVTVGTAMMLVSDPITTTGTGMGLSIDYNNTAN